MERYIAPPLDSSWPLRARCTDGDPDALFVQGAAQNNAVRICRRCPVRRECAADALNARREEGAWGGMTDRERRQLIRIVGKRAINWRPVFRRFPPQFTFNQVLVVAQGIKEKIDTQAASTQTAAPQTVPERSMPSADIPRPRDGETVTELIGVAVSEVLQPVASE